MRHPHWCCSRRPAGVPCLRASPAPTLSALCHELTISWRQQMHVPRRLSESWLVRGTSWRLSTGVCVRQMAVSDLALRNCASHAWRDSVAWSPGWAELLGLCCLPALCGLCMALWVFLEVLEAEWHLGPSGDHSTIRTSLPPPRVSPPYAHFYSRCLCGHSMDNQVATPGPLCLLCSLQSVSHSPAALRPL